LTAVLLVGADGLGPEHSDFCYLNLDSYKDLEKVKPNMHKILNENIAATTY
jgi:hypothetical protein